MVSLWFFSLVCLELFATVTAIKPILQRTPRNHSPQIDKKISGLLVLARQSGPCCSAGGCCNAGEFCNGDGCCINGDTACTAAQGGGCCLGNEYCDIEGCCLKGEVCSGPPAGTVTFGGGGGGGGGGGSGFTDTSFPSGTLSSSEFPSPNTTPLGPGAGFGSTALPAPLSTSVPSGAGFGSTPFPSAASNSLSAGGLGTTPVLVSAVSGGGNFPSPSPAAGSGSGAGAGAGGVKSSATSKGVLRQGSVLIAVAILSVCLL